MDANSRVITVRAPSRPPAVSAAPHRADAEHAEGWLEGVRAARAAVRAAAAPWKLNAREYLEGWMDAATLQPVDPIRLAETRTPYVKGYAAGAKQYERALGGAGGGGAGGGGYDAE